MDGRHEARSAPALSALWGSCADIALRLDAAEDQADWHLLLAVAGDLVPLADELELAVRQQRGRVRRAENALRALRDSVEWVAEHQYRASEADLHRRLGTALRQAMDTLDVLEQARRDRRAGETRQDGSLQAAVDRVQKPMVDDTLEIKGLAGTVAVEATERLDLTLGWHEHTYQVDMVRVTGGWLLRVRNEQGRSVTEANSFSMTLESALGCALLDVLWEGRGAEPGAPPRRRGHPTAVTG